MLSPFDDPDINFLVIVNDDGQHSMWLAQVTVPNGWTITARPTEMIASVMCARTGSTWKP